jgi:hypothetical protein
MFKSLRPQKRKALITHEEINPKKLKKDDINIKEMEDLKVSP